MVAGPSDNSKLMDPRAPLLVLSYAATVVDVFYKSLSLTPSLSNVLMGQTVIDAPESSKAESTCMSFKEMDKQRGSDRHSLGAHSSSGKMMDWVLHKFIIAWAMPMAGRFSLTVIP